MVVYGIVYGIGFAYFIRARGLVASWPHGARHLGFLLLTEACNMAAYMVFFTNISYVVQLDVDFCRFSMFFDISPRSSWVVFRGETYHIWVSKKGGLAHDMPDLMHLRGIPFTGRPCFVPAFCWPIAPRTPWGSWWWSDSRVACWSKQRLRRPGANIPWKELHHDHTMNKWWWSRGCYTKVTLL